MICTDDALIWLCRQAIDNQIPNHVENYLQILSAYPCSDFQTRTSTLGWRLVWHFNIRNIDNYAHRVYAHFIPYNKSPCLITVGHQGLNKLDLDVLMYYIERGEVQIPPQYARLCESAKKDRRLAVKGLLHFLKSEKGYAQ